MKPNKEVIARIRSGLASEQELRDLGRENVLAIKSDADSVHYRYSVKRKPRSLDEKSRTIEHVASTEAVDRMGDRISVKGWDLSGFKRNPVLLWDHRQGDLPLGLVPRATKGRGEDGEPALLTLSRFHEAEKNEFAELVYRMVADGDLPAVSVGFNPKDVVRPSSVEESIELGLGEWGVYFKAQELLELSVVTVPAHGGALARSVDSDVMKKLKRFEDEGVYHAEVIERVSKLLAGESDPTGRVFEVKHPEFEVVDDLSGGDGGDGSDGADDGAAGSSDDVDGDGFAAPEVDPVATAVQGKGAAGEAKVVVHIDAAQMDELRSLTARIVEAREATTGVDASARLIRSIVQDVVTDALSAFAKKQGSPQDAPSDSPAGSGGDGEHADGDPETKTFDLYGSFFEKVSNGLSNTNNDNDSTN